MFVCTYVYGVPNNYGKVRARAHRPSAATSPYVASFSVRPSAEAKRRPTLSARLSSLLRRARPRAGECHAELARHPPYEDSRPTRCRRRRHCRRRCRFYSQQLAPPSVPITRNIGDVLVSYTRSFAPICWLALAIR